MAVVTPEDLIVVGRISGLYGVRGWCKVYSYTDPRANILEYGPWHLKIDDHWERRAVQEGREQGQGIVVRLEGCDDREAARALIDAVVAVQRGQLPPAGPDEHYWADLVGLEVRTSQGARLGRLESLFATGANDVMVVRDDRERLIPYVRGDIVLDVDLDKRVMTVDWDPEY